MSFDRPMSRRQCAAWWWGAICLSLAAWFVVIFFAEFLYQAVAK